MSGDTSKTPRVDVIGSQISVCDMHTALELVDARCADGRGGYVCFTNVHAVVYGRQHPPFQVVTKQSFLSVADGKPVYWVGRVKGARGLGHVPGPDFFPNALRRFSKRRHFFYGSTPAVLERLISKLRAEIPDLQICGVLSPPFRTPTAAELEQHYQAIRDARADFVWVGLGAPKQEQWMAGAAPHVAPTLLFGIGAAFDFHAGTVKRAPRLMGALGLEWLYRLYKEPRRLWRRYLVTNTLYVWYLCRDLMLTRSGG